tara:strand:- start:77 stop:415 length:339 start_codon:yes stop_codon:yes gene_type:complete
MQRLPKRIIDGARLTTSAGIYYTTLDNTLMTVSAITLMNDTSGAVTATIHLVPFGATPTSLNKVLSARTIAPGESYNVGSVIGQTMAAGGTIQALASVAASISIIASGYETT